MDKTRETPAEVRARWRYLRGLLAEQLRRFECGVMKLHADGVDVSQQAMAKLRQNISDFDRLIAASERCGA